MDTSKENKRTRLSPTARRLQLLEIGFEILLNEPLEHLTVDRVASEAGVSRGLVFHYFPTVRELHLACLEQASRDLVAKVAEAAVGDVSADRVRKSLEAFIGYLENQAQTFIMMSSFAASDDDFGRIFEAVRGQMVDLMLDRAHIPPDPLIILMLRSWVSFVEAAILQWIVNPPVERAELIEMLVAVKDDVQSYWESLAATTT